MHTERIRYLYKYLIKWFFLDNGVENNLEDLLKIWITRHFTSEKRYVKDLKFRILN